MELKRTPAQLAEARIYRARVFAKAQAAYEVTCPRCGRGPGKQCLTRHYRKANMPHIGRIELGLEAQK